MSRRATMTALVSSLLVAERRVQKITQGELARRVGLSQSALSRVERGEAEMTVAQFDRYAQALGVRASSILRRAENVL